ncbi:sigma factor [Rhodonellum sp.]|uniref:sigma factor n=1 Tax=Rhodonellum sp. TaxID=2231180 RepID=UPI00271EC3FD|nr:sigma factor [Rhodonellum sp.]MDO9553873.1 sigma factor [Rhodonellum sp.]
MEGIPSILVFFGLKRVGDLEATSDILQNSFLKVHLHRHSLKNTKHAKAWVYQIVRNEISDYYNNIQQQKQNSGLEFHPANQNLFQDYCCFDRFMNDLPLIYKSPIEIVYLIGKKKKEAADILGIGLSNLKARIRRGKALQKMNFLNCCKFKIDKNGYLTGEANCGVCGKL